MTLAHSYRTVLDKGEKSCLRALLYFDIFSYPLTEQEVVRFSPYEAAFDVKKALSSLLQQRLIFQVGNFYSVRPDAYLGEKRTSGNRLAATRMKAAHRFSKLVASFPFVKAVFLSGSLSKGFMDEKSDIDFFIITEAERVWIVRAALALFRRVFLFNSHRNLCTNYLIDAENLTIPDRNYFTAVELATLVPMHGHAFIQALQSCNEWVKDFLPRHTPAAMQGKDYRFAAKRAVEKILPGKALSKLNRWLMDSTLKYWKRKYANSLDDRDFEVAFRSRPGVSKSHPQFFQKKALDRLAQKIKHFENWHSVDLSL